MGGCHGKVELRHVMDKGMGEVQGDCRGGGGHLRESHEVMVWGRWLDFRLGFDGRCQGLQATEGGP